MGGLELNPELALRYPTLDPDDNITTGIISHSGVVSLTIF